MLRVLVSGQEKKYLGHNSFACSMHHMGLRTYCEPSLTLSLLSAYIYNYAKIKTEVFLEYDSSLLGELYGKFSSILVHGK